MLVVAVTVPDLYSFCALALIAAADKAMPNAALNNLIFIGFLVFLVVGKSSPARLVIKSPIISQFVFGQYNLSILKFRVQIFFTLYFLSKLDTGLVELLPLTF